MSESKPSPSTPKMMPIKDLVEHPWQYHYFPPCTDEENAVLKADLAANGQRDPVQVAPPGNAANLKAYTILDGHRRVELLRELGKTDVLVIVRQDFVGLDAHAMEAVFISYNLNRRHLSKLAIAFAAKRIFEIERRKAHDHTRTGELESRDRIGKMVGMSGRNLSRLMRVLHAPVLVQRAWEAGYVRLTTAEKVADLPREQHQVVSAELQQAGLEKAKSIIERYVGRPAKKHLDVSAAFRSFTKALERHLADLDDRTTEIEPGTIGRGRATLTRARKVIDGLLQRAKRPLTKAEQDANVIDSMDKLKRDLDQGILLVPPSDTVSDP